MDLHTMKLSKGIPTASATTSCVTFLSLERFLILFQNVFVSIYIIYQNSNICQGGSEKFYGIEWFFLLAVNIQNKHRNRM